MKRTLSLKGAPSVAITTTENAYTSALDELGSVRRLDGDFVDEKLPYLNVFAAAEAKSGYRTAKYISNGTNTTIGGNDWQRSVIQFDDSKPRKMSLKDGYEDHLAELLLTRNDKEPLPNLTDTAVWYFRGKDVESFITSGASTSQQLEELTNEFVSRVGLSPNEISRVFDHAINDSETEEEPAFVDVAPEPSEYLPGKVAQPKPDSVEGPGPVSFELVSALSAKNFVILTGPSGTGKSLAALRLAEGIQRKHLNDLDFPIFELVPVGPDWTSPKKLIGFRTPFGKERQADDGSTTNESYELTSTLRLILRASHPSAAEIPHFLVFDEMNLSHVERYFAPFLSLMEAASIVDDDGSVSLLDDDDFALVAQLLKEDPASSMEAEAAQILLTEGRGLALPPNLFFVGTVNVDETTYMFSPKVLDRAHVIELTAERPSTYLKEDQLGGSRSLSVDTADRLLEVSIATKRAKAEVFNPAAVLANATDLPLSDVDRRDIADQLTAALDGCFDLLSPVGFAFGYRVSKEVFAYVVAWLRARHAVGGDAQALLAEWPEALDRAILQKVLPKLHGNKRLLGESLRATSAFLAGNHGTSTEPARYALGAGSEASIPESGKLKLPGSEPYLPLSRRKLDWMQTRLSAAGYVSFVS